MKCPFCNEELPQGSCFCSNCGSRVENVGGSAGYVGNEADVRYGGNGAGAGYGAENGGGYGGNGGVNNPSFYQAAPNQGFPSAPQKKGKGKWIAIGAAAAVVLTGCVAAAGFLLTAKSPKEKVIAAFDQTFDSKDKLPSEQIFGLSQFADMVKHEDVEEGIGLTLSDASVYGMREFKGSGFDMEVKNSFSQKKASVGMSVSYNGMKLADGQVYYGDDRLMASVPQISSYAFLLDMSGDFGSRLNDSPIVGYALQSYGVDGDELASVIHEVMDKSYDTENRPFDLGALLNRYREGCKAKEKFKEALTVEKVKGDKKEFTVNGKSQKCQKYTMVISREAMIDFLEESSDFFLDDEILRDDFLNQLELAARISKMMGQSFGSQRPKDMLDDVYGDAKDGVDDLIRMLNKSLDDVEMVVYLDKKGNLVAFSGETNVTSDGQTVDVEFEMNLKGGDHPLQNLNAAVELSCDGEHITADLERVGKMSDKELTDKISLDMNVIGERGGVDYTMSYGRKDGSLQMEMEISGQRLKLATLSLAATVDELKKGESVHMDIDELRIEEHMGGEYVELEGEFYLKPLASEIDEPSGKIFDVLEANMLDWYSLGEEIEEKAEDTFGDFF